jgi:hypothetical protein
MLQDRAMGRWGVIVVLATAQFIMVLDTTVMNVSLSAVVKDLNTTVADLQLAITMYALTMAAFMLTGGKLGDVWGRRRTTIRCNDVGAADADATDRGAKPRRPRSGASVWRMRSPAAARPATR